MRLNFRLPGSVLSGFERQVVSARTRGLKFNGRRISAEAVMGAILLHFADLPESERDEIVRKGTIRLEGILAGSTDEPAPAPAKVKPATNPVDITAEVVKAPARRGKRPAG